MRGSTLRLQKRKVFFEFGFLRQEAVALFSEGENLFLTDFRFLFEGKNVGTLFCGFYLDFSRRSFGGIGFCQKLSELFPRFVQFALFLRKPIFKLGSRSIGLF